MLIGGDDRAHEEAQVEIAAMAARLLAKVREKIIDGDRGSCAHDAPRLVMRGGLWEGYRMCR